MQIMNLSLEKSENVSNFYYLYFTLCAFKITIMKVQAEDEKKAIKAAESFLYKVVQGLMIVVANLQIYRE